ncbi:BnaC04g13320D [Brassica napus]|uniref:BnaC04g13320D protein n=1 Tax=Brassica napus TaxID=3708 RepID=A0A078GHT6_BRANA|nr:BnaC04g13320D [Brassica napus]
MYLLIFFFFGCNIKINVLWFRVSAASSQVGAVVAVCLCAVQVLSLGGPSMTTSRFSSGERSSYARLAVAALVLVCQLLCCCWCSFLSGLPGCVPVLPRGVYLVRLLGASSGSRRWHESVLWKGSFRMWLSPLPFSDVARITSEVELNRRFQFLALPVVVARAEVQRLGSKLHETESIIWSSAAGKPISTKAWSDVSSKMDEMCLVMCGGWVCGSDGKWEFVVEKKRMARMVAVEYGVSLSYWPPDSLELATGIKTPPVVLTSDGALKYFFTHMKVKGSMNLFATFESLGGDVFEASESKSVGFDTPVMNKKHGGSLFGRKGENVSSVGSKTFPKINFINDDDVELVEEVEMFEERMKSESMATGVDDVGGCSEGIDGDYVGPEEIDERDVRPRGYDYQFWEPLIAGDLGGSNAVEVIFNDKEDPGLVKMEAARRAHSSDGKNGEHGQSSRGWGNGDDEAEVPMDDLSWMGRTRGPNKKAVPNKCGRCRGTGHNRTNCTVPLK